MPVKIGLEKLDSELKGGISDKSSILLFGPPKSGKTLFGMHFLFEGLSNDEYGIFIITNNFPEELVKRLENIGKVDLILEKGLLRFVDCYSAHAGVEKGNTMFIVRVNGPIALTEIGIAFIKIMKQIPRGSKVRLVLDSVSTLIIHNSPRTIATFIQKLNEATKSAGVSSMFILEEGMHEEKDVATLNSILDMMIHLKSEKDKNFIEVVGIGAPKPINYIIQNGKIKCS